MTWHQLFCFLFLYLSAKDCFFLCKQDDFDRQLNGPVNGLLSLVIMQNLFSNVLKSNPNSWLTFFCFLSGCCFVSTHASGHTGVCGGKKIHLSREDQVFMNHIWLLLLSGAQSGLHYTVDNSVFHFSTSHSHSQHNHWLPLLTPHAQLQPLW